MCNASLPVFVIGVARSGTTVSARIAAASSYASTALIDSQRGFFRAARQEYAASADMNIHFDEALWDSFFSGERRNFIDLIQQADLTTLDISKYIENITSIASNASSRYSPLIIDSNFYSGIKTVRDGINKVLQLCATREKPVVVFKDNYIIEYARALKLAFPHAKFLFPYRDPRAVVASRIAGGVTFSAGTEVHLISRMRSWRSALAWAFSFMAEFPNDVLLIPYEQLVSQPKVWAERISSVLGVPFEEGMLGAAGFTTGGEADGWRNNSSFKNKEAGIFSSSVEKWRQILPETILKGIEYLGYHEMHLLGYLPEKITALPVTQREAESFLENDRHVGPTVWRCDTKSFEEEVACEQARHACIARGQADHEEARFNLLTMEMARQLGVEVSNSNSSEKPS